jgi:hypothetical protein
LLLVRRKIADRDWPNIYRDARGFELPPQRSLGWRHHRTPELSGCLQILHDLLQAQLRTAVVQAASDAEQPDGALGRVSRLGSHHPAVGRFGSGFGRYPGRERDSDRGQFRIRAIEKSHLRAEHGTVFKPVLAAKIEPKLEA